MGLQGAGCICWYISFPISQASRDLTLCTDLVTFACIIVFVFRFRADHDQFPMTRLMRAILHDGVLYFFVMAAFHIVIAFFTFFTAVIPASVSFGGR